MAAAEFVMQPLNIHTSTSARHQSVHKTACVCVARLRVSDAMLTLVFRLAAAIAAAIAAAATAYQRCVCAAHVTAALACV